MFYRRKLIVVEAYQWFPAVKKEGHARPSEKYGVRFCPPSKVDASATRGIVFDRPARYVVDTEYGPLEVQPGDWMVFIAGKWHPTKPSDFEALYEKLPAGAVGIQLIDRLISFFRREK